MKSDTRVINFQQIRFIIHLIFMNIQHKHAWIEKY